MGEKETSREASAPSISERSSVQDFEKNTDLAGAGDEDSAARGKAIIRNTDSTARESPGAAAKEHVYQYNQTDLEFRSQAPGGSAAESELRGKPTKEQ